MESRIFSKSSLGWCPVYKAASTNVFAHFCSDYLSKTTCLDKDVKLKGFEGGFWQLDELREQVRVDEG